MASFRLKNGLGSMKLENDPSVEFQKLNDMSRFKI